MTAMERAQAAIAQIAVDCDRDKARRLQRYADNGNGSVVEAVYPDQAAQWRAIAGHEATRLNDRADQAERWAGR